jgi:hypothetical protein
MSDDQQKLANLVAAAESGNVDACYELGFRFFYIFQHENFGPIIDLQFFFLKYLKQLSQRSAWATCRFSVGTIVV